MKFFRLYLFCVLWLIMALTLIGFFVSELEFYEAVEIAIKSTFFASFLIAPVTYACYRLSKGDAL